MAFFRADRPQTAPDMARLPLKTMLHPADRDRVAIDHSRARKIAETGQRGNLNSGFQKWKTGRFWGVLQSDIELLSLLISSARITSFMQIVENFFLN